MSCLVIEQVAVDEGGRSNDVGPTTLHLKVCNQSRNVPAGRWKKGPEGSKASTHVAVCHVAIQSAVDEAGRSVDVRPTALHAKVCNQSRNVPAGRWIGLEKASTVD